MQDINEKLWIVVIKRGGHKWPELYVKFRVYNLLIHILSSLFTFFTTNKI